MTALSEKSRADRPEFIFVGDHPAIDKRFTGSLYRPDTRWDYVIAVDWTAETEFYRQLDELSAYTYEATGTGKGMLTKTPGIGQAYLATYRDKDGHAFDSTNTYRLHVPPNAPAKNFWSVTLYDLDTRTFIENKEEIADRSSRMDLRKNDDGGVDVYFGPTAPAGLRRTGFRPFPARRGSPISVFMGRWKHTSTRAGRCQTSRK